MTLQIFKRPSMGTQIKIIILLHHLVVIGAVLTLPISWYWLLASCIGMGLLKIGGEIGYHRYFAHRSFETTKWKERMMLLLGAMKGAGSTLAWCGTHRIHHKNSDTPNDPHSPHHQNNILVWLTFWKPFVIPTSVVKDFIKDPWHMFIHRHYIELVLGFMLILFLIHPLLLAFGLSLPAIIIFHSGALLVNVACHKWGYRNYDTPDQSYNNTLVNILTGGSGLHNNHHAQPRNPYLNHKKGEWDMAGFIIRKFLAK